MLISFAIETRIERSLLEGICKWFDIVTMETFSWERITIFGWEFNDGNRAGTRIELQQKVWNI